MPNLKELKNWENANIVKDPNGKKLLNGNQPMVALFMAIFG